MSQCYERHTATYLTLHLVGQSHMESDAIQFTGVEQWGGFYGWDSHEVPATFTGADFHRHAGTRVHNTAGSAVYRRIYHERLAGRRLKGLKGTMVYTPAPGITLPEIEINV